jgi:hypothetical protein
MLFLLKAQMMTNYEMVAKLTSGTNFTTFITTQTLSHNYTQNKRSAVSSIASNHSDRSNQDKVISIKQISKF